MRLLVFIILILSSFHSKAANTFEKALTAFNSNQVEVAYIHLKNALKDNPDNLAAKVLMGKVLMHKQYFGDGIMILNEALSEGADLNLFLNELGNALMIAREYQQIIELGKGKTLNHSNKISWYLMLANAYGALENNEEARKYYNLAYVLAPEDDRILGSFSAFELAQENYKSAETYINKAITLYPKQSRMWQLRGQLYQQQNDFQNSIAAYKKAYDVDNNDPIVQRSLAKAYTYAGKYSDALLLIDQILSTTPEDPMAKLLKSQLLVNTARIDEAKAVLEDISQKLSLYSDEERTKNSTIIYVAGAAAYLQNDLELAQKELLRYLIEVPDDFAAINMLVNIYLRQNLPDKALSLLETKESLIVTNLNLATKLVDLYLQNYKTYKAERLLSTLEKDFKDRQELILAKVNYLIKIENYDAAINLLEQHKPKEFSPAFLLTKGFIFRADGQTNKANKIADELLKLKPSNSDYLSFKGILLLEQRQWQEALTTFQQVLLNKPEDFSSLFNIASAKAALNQFDEAKAITTKLLESQPDHIPLRILNAKLDRDLDNSPQALEALTSITKANKTNINASELLVDIYIKEKDFDAALSELDRLTKIVFLSPKYIKQKINIHLALKDKEQAAKQIGILEGLIEGPKELYELSLLFIKIDNIPAAQNSLERALALAPENLIIKLELVKVDIHLKAFNEANRKLKTLEKEFPNNPNVLVVRGDLLLQTQKLSQASTKYAKALSLDNSFTQALVKLYQLTTKGIGNAKFVELTSAIIEKQPNYHFMRNLIADHALNNGDTKAAKAHYEILIKADNIPSKALLFNNLANISLKEDLVTAKAYVLQALALDENSPAIVDTYGWITSIEGNLEEGLTILRRAYAMDSNEPAINYHLGYTLYKLNRLEEAKKELSRALAIGGTFYEKEDAQALLDSITETENSL